MIIKRYFLLPLFAVAAFISCKKEGNATEAEIAEPVAAKTIPPASQKYTADTLASVIEWTGSKPTGSHSGTISLHKGSIFVKNDSLESGSFILDMATITVTDPKEGKERIDLENHLKGLKEGNADHFFNIKKYPTGTFEITGIKPKDSLSLIEGNLTLKDITKNITFPARVAVMPDSVTIESDEFTINRTLWNINYSSKSVFENLGDKYINDDIKLKVKVKATRQ
jgi:polyisoprenoid-binding protein YceI